MSQSILSKWVVSLACVAGVFVSATAFAHGGGGHGGGGHGGGGHAGGHSGGHVGGGHHSGGGHHYSGGGHSHGGSGHHYGGGGYGGFGGFYGGIGGLGYYGGYPSYGYGNYGYGNGFYTAQPIYSQPVYSTGIYSQPVNTNPIYFGNAPVVTSQQVVSSTPQTVYDNGEIVLFSPPSNTQDVQYSLNGNPYTMKPGTLQKFTNDRTWTIDVSTGSGQTVKYTLSTGRFKFKQFESGMGLFTTQDQPESPVAVPESASPSSPATTTPAPTPMPVE